MPMFGFVASPRNGAAAGAVAIGLYAAGGLLVGTPDDFGAPAAGAAAYFNGRQTEIQIGSALFAASALLDYSFLAIAMGSFLTAGVFAGFAMMVLRDGALWPRWLGWLAVAAAVACALRVGTLFTADGPFTAGGLVGFWLPIAGFAGWIAAGSLVLSQRIPK